MGNIRKTFGQKNFSIGSGGAAAQAELNSWIVTGVNQILLPTTLNGIKWVADAPTSTTQDWSVLAISALTPIAPAGIGICQNIETQELKLIANVGAQVPWRGDLVNGNLVSLSTKTINISGVSYTDPETLLSVTPVYVAYIPSMRY